jgi:hypothetical protein
LDVERVVVRYGTNIERNMTAEEEAGVTTFSGVKVKRRSVYKDTLIRMLLKQAV